MGFPGNYHLPNNHKLAVHMLGNAVPPPLARLLEDMEKAGIAGPMDSGGHRSILK